MNKIVLASLLGTAVMFAGQAPATPEKAQANSSQPGTTTKVKKHHKKGKKAPASTSSAVSKPAAKQ